MRYKTNLLKFRCMNDECRFSTLTGTGENKGTMFYRKKSSKAEITKVLHSLAEDMGIRAAGRVHSKNKNTVISWLLQAAGIS